MSSSLVSRPPRSPFWRIAPIMLFVCGAVLAAWPLAQNGFAWWNQRQLRAQWEASAAPLSSSKGSPPRSQVHKIGAPVSSIKGAAPVARVAWPPTRIIIPTLGVDNVVVDGTDGDSLKRGPGHQPGTALPGADGNCVIAGHRNIYGSPFARINEMSQGDIIELRMPHQTVRYEMLGLVTSNDSDVSVMQPPPAGAPPRLTLITCTVPHSWQRIVLLAEKVNSDNP